jgi:hypothetical protein
MAEDRVEAVSVRLRKFGGGRDAPAVEGHEDVYFFHIFFSVICVVLGWMLLETMHVLQLLVLWVGLTLGSPDTRSPRLLSFCLGVSWIGRWASFVLMFCIYLSCLSEIRVCVFCKA